MCCTDAVTAFATPAREALSARLTWYARRLRSTSAAEVAWRTSRDSDPTDEVLEHAEVGIAATREPAVVSAIDRA